MKIGLAAKWGTDDKYCGVVHTSALLNLLAPTNDVLGAQPNSGNGTRAEPYRNLNMANWRWLAKQAATPDSVFYRAGNQLLVRWGSKMGGLVNYISDMTGHTDLLDEVEQTHDEKKVKQAFTEADEKLGIDTTLAPYHKKALRVQDITDEEAAQRCRNLLADSTTDCSSCPEIASSFCALFIAEAYRAPKTFVASLMLLDLVESHTTYGVEGGKFYNWKSMLMHSTFKKEAIDVPGRAQEKNVPLAKHPMAGIGTVNLSNQITNWGTDNAVRDRVVSLISIWVGHNLQATHRDRKYYLLRTGSKTGIRDQVKTITFSDKKCDQELLEQCKSSIAQRCGTPGVLIGGTSLEYLDFEGQLV